MENGIVTIPTFPDEVYNYYVEWDNDGTFDTMDITGDCTYQYATLEYKQMRIGGPFPRFYFNNRADAIKLNSIDQWGNRQWTSMANAFAGCASVYIYGGSGNTQDMTNVTDISNAFKNCIYITDISWDVSGVTKFDSVFANVGDFSAVSVKHWNISSATSMNGMFHNTTLKTNLYETRLTAWHRVDPGEGPVPTNIDFDGGGSNYCASQSVVDDLTSTHGWSIADDGYYCITKWNPVLD